MKIKWAEKKLALAGFIGLFVAPVLIVEIYKAALYYKPKCKVEGCDVIREGKKYCAIHRCRYGDCDEYAEVRGQYCKEHAEIIEKQLQESREAEEAKKKRQEELAKRRKEQNSQKSNNSSNSSNNNNSSDGSNKTQGNSSCMDDDKYYVYDYDDPEDFYEEWPEEFDGFEDAEDYWDEYWDE